MSRLFHCAALAALVAIGVPSASYARVQHNGAGAITGGQNGVESEMGIRKQCYEEARTRYPSTNQDMQTNRDFAYRTCAADRGIRNP